MNAFKRMLSLLLSLLLIVSVFTIIPMTASAETVQVFARKWVEADLETGDYFSFTDLYQNFIICRCNPDFDDTNFNVDDASNVYNRTGNISLGSYNEIRLNSWNDGSGHLGFYTSTNGGAQGDGRIYLSTNGDNNINFNTDNVKWYAYTWETFTADHVAAEASTCEIVGNIEYYTAGSRYFKPIEGTTDGNQNVEQIAEEEIDAPLAPHQTEYVDEVSADCVTAGMSAHYECTVCHRCFSDQDGVTEVTAESLTINALGHAMTHIDGVSSSCTQEGIIEHWHCSRCGKYFADENGNIEISGDLTIPPSPYDHTYQVTFNWDGFTCTTAEVRCTECNFIQSLDDVTVTSEITTQPTGDADGVRTYTASVEFDGDTYTDTKTETVLSYFPKHNLTLEGEIGVNFYVNVSAEDVANKAEVIFAWSNKTETVTLGGNPVAVDGMALYKATVCVSAPEMNDEITATLYIDNVETAVHHYSVRAYCDVILSDDYRESYSSDRFEYEDLATLVKTMLNYGATAQLQFYHNDETEADLANHDINYDLIDMGTDEIASIDGVLPKSADTAEDLSGYGVSYYGCSLLLRSKTTLRFYFKKTDASKFDDTVFKINGQTATVKDYQEGSTYVYVEITDIAAPRLADAYTVSVGSVTIGTVSPLTYVKDVLSDDSAEDELKNVMTALYRFYEAAAELFPNNN